MNMYSISEKEAAQCPVVSHHQKIKALKCKIEQVLKHTDKRHYASRIFQINYVRIYVINYVINYVIKKSA